jgi:hypothetical protein
MMARKQSFKRDAGTAESGNALVGNQTVWYKRETQDEGELQTIDQII